MERPIHDTHDYRCHPESGPEHASDNGRRYLLILILVYARFSEKYAYLEACPQDKEGMRSPSIPLRSGLAAYLSYFPPDAPLPFKPITPPPSNPIFEIFASTDVASTPRHHRRSTSGIGAATSAAGGFGIQFPTTPGRPPTPLTSPRSPFPEWAASIFRTSTGGSTIDVEGLALDGANKGDRDRPLSPRDDGGTPSRSRSFRRAASTSWW